MQQRMKNEQGFSYTCWFDVDFETLYKKRTWTKKKLGRSSSQLLYKQIRIKYTTTCTNKKVIQLQKNLAWN